MRFWLSIVLGTILISFGMTWMLMHQGGQINLDALQEKVPAPQAPPELVLEGVEMTRNYIEIDAGESFVGKPARVEVAFRNDGKGPLTIALLSTNCDCVHDITINGKKL